MVSLQQQKLPQLFGVMDPSPSLPSRYYVFMAYEGHYTSIQIVDNMKFSKPFTVWITHDEQELPFTSRIYYSDAETEVTFWDTGINIMSDENELIPVLDFKTPLLLPNESNRISPVYVSPDSIISKSAHQIIARSRRNEMMDILLDLTYAELHYTPPEPPAIQRLHPAIKKAAPEASFSLPPHAAATFVRALIQDKKLCSITTNSFDEITVVGITPCFHCFDCEALETWLSAHKSCPECRSSVATIVKYKR